MTQLKFTKEEYVRMLHNEGYEDPVILLNEEEKTNFVMSEFDRLDKEKILEILHNIEENHLKEDRLKKYKTLNDTFLKIENDAPINNLPDMNEDIFKINKRMGER